LRERDHLEEIGVDGTIILRLSSGSGLEGMYWIELAQVRNRWRALVNAVMKVWVP